MHTVDYLVVGSGLAGLFIAHRASAYGQVMLITKKGLRDSNSYNAQGGIAAVVAEGDAPENHFKDTIIAGRELCDTTPVNVLVHEGPDRIEQIISEGMQFDEENGHLALGLEGGHHKNRILHAGGDSTGKEITEFVISKVLHDKNISIEERYSVLELLEKDGTCYGVRAWDKTENKEVLIYAKNTFLASGGAAAIFSRTTNPNTTVGDGIAMAYKAGCRIVDMEFIQFHPSGLYIPDTNRAFLISEAVRGEGAHLLNKDGERYMVPLHELAELAPRDIVARANYAQMKKDGLPYITLSLKHLDGERIKKRFPTINKACQQFGYDLTDQIPIAPAAHYTVGGVSSDLYGRTDLKHLYVCGEVASTGIMGANRLASNSLLECLVFGDRAVQDATQGESINAWPEFENIYYRDGVAMHAYHALQPRVQKIMDESAGIIRNEADILEGLKKIAAEREALHTSIDEYFHVKMDHLLTVAELILKSALYRKESRGGHYREDYPHADEHFKFHIIQQLDKDITTKKVN